MSAPRDINSGHSVASSSHATDFLAYDGPISASPDSDGLRLPKNKSTGNLLSLPTTAASDAHASADRSRIRFSFDAGVTEHNVSRPSLLVEDAAPGPSGLRRIRQQPPLRISNAPSSVDSSVLMTPSPGGAPYSAPYSGMNSIAGSRSASRSASRSGSVLIPPGPTSPGLEDLHRFPSESLHSFSFAHQSEDHIHSRQNILKRSIDFMKDRLGGWNHQHAGLLSAQARINGDADLQSMMELLTKANLIGKDGVGGLGEGMGLGPITGPAEIDVGNPFDKSFNKDAIRQTLLDGNDLSPISTAVEDSNDPELALRRMQSAPSSRRASLKRTYTDTEPLSLQGKLMEALAQPYEFDPTGANNPPHHRNALQNFGASGSHGGNVHSHSSKWTPSTQAIFRTSAEAPWTIESANDLACLVFGVTRAEVRKLGILEVVQEERRHWLAQKLQTPFPIEKDKKDIASSPGASKTRPPTAKLGMGNGLTAKLLSKPSSRDKASKRAQTDDGAGNYYAKIKQARNPNHPATKSRGVLLCGDVVPIQKRDGSTGSASLWVMEKRKGLIWVLEEITENVAYLQVDDEGTVTGSKGETEQIWGVDHIKDKVPISRLLPYLPKEVYQKEEPSKKSKDTPKSNRLHYYTARTTAGVSVPATVSQATGPHDVRVSSFPHIAGIVVLSSSTLEVKSSNSVFCAALLGQDRPEGKSISELIPQFVDLLRILQEEDEVQLVDGIVIPEHSFRRARALLALREGKETAANIFLRPQGIGAKHRDGSEITVDIQMRVVKSETIVPGKAIEETGESEDDDDFAVTEVVYALWITYSRHLHAGSFHESTKSPFISRPSTPPAQPLPDMALMPVMSPAPQENVNPFHKEKHSSLLAQQIHEAASLPISDKPLVVPKSEVPPAKPVPPKKKTINDFVILEEMGQGAYGQVKLARRKDDASHKVVLKYVTKRRILVDTWTRDRKLGTIPLEIHILNYLRRDDLRHPNIVEMEGFFEDDINYYIEMVPHGLPGMDLFDYIELRSNMEEGECRNIFKQVVDAIHHLHTKALVVHRDIKDENVVLDGEGRIKLIDFGSAAYIKNGPFDVFVGTIDYAAPEVLHGKTYRGKEQDVWALGILLYTIVYKENPFYNVDEIMDHPLRVPYIPFSEDCIDLIRKMLDRDVDERLSITEVLEHEWMVEE